MKLNDAVAIRIEEILKEKNISKYKLEKQCGLTHTALRNIFNGKNGDIRLATICRIAHVLEVDLAEFFKDEKFENDLENIWFWCVMKISHFFINI